MFSFMARAQAPGTVKLDAYQTYGENDIVAWVNPAEPRPAPQVTVVAADVTNANGASGATAVADPFASSGSSAVTDTPASRASAGRQPHDVPCQRCVAHDFSRRSVHVMASIEPFENLKGRHARRRTLLLFVLTVGCVLLGGQDGQPACRTAPFGSRERLDPPDCAQPNQTLVQRTRRGGLGSDHRQDCGWHACRPRRRSRGAPATDSLLTTVVQIPAPGTYTVNWRAVSADGHPISGSFVFSVGHVDPLVAVSAERSDRQFRALFAALRPLAPSARTHHLDRSRRDAASCWGIPAMPCSRGVCGGSRDSARWSAVPAAAVMLLAQTVGISGSVAEAMNRDAVRRRAADPVGKPMGCPHFDSRRADRGDPSDGAPPIASTPSSLAGPGCRNRRARGPDSRNSLERSFRRNASGRPFGGHRLAPPGGDGRLGWRLAVAERLHPAVDAGRWSRSGGGRCSRASSPASPTCPWWPSNC